MKKTGLILMALLLVVPKASAKKDLAEPLEKNELAFEYGYITGPEFINTIIGVFASAFSLGHYTLENLNCTGLMALQYHRTVGKRISLGCSAGYEYMYMTFKDKDGEHLDKDMPSHNVCILPSMKIFYNNWEHFSMYAKLQGGIWLTTFPNTEADLSSSELSVWPAFSIVPFGMEFGGKNVRGFIEPTIGTQGIFSAGVRMSF